MIQRRQLMRLSSIGFFLSSSLMNKALAREDTKTPWKTICKRWLNILMPTDEYGAGADNPEVWNYLFELMEDKNFKRGIIAGFRALDHIVIPPNDEALTSLMSQRAPVSQFLNAFFEIVVESYYGTAPGWNDIGINAPQPQGYEVKPYIIIKTGE